MTNFIFNTIKYDKCGMKYRYNDFMMFLKDYKIDYTVSTQITPTDFNIVDINYICDNPDIELNNSCYIFCGSSKKMFEAIPYYIIHKKKLNYQHYISHNLYYAQCFGGVFLPMFLHTNNITLVDSVKHYKYGIFATHYDVIYLLLNEILDALGVNYSDILFLDNEDCVNAICNKTSDKNVFYSSIETFLDFTDYYTNRHVMSRTYLELIANDIPIQIISFNQSKPISFTGFSHVQYEILAKHELFDLLSVQYEPKYFRTDIYSNYIKYILSNIDKPIKLPTVEDYTNENFNVLN